MRLESVLPRDFWFTQNSIAAFDSCPLKFKRRYIDGLNWDNLHDRDSGERMEMGRRFHLLAKRYFLGVDTGLEENCEGCRNLDKWFKSLKSSFRLSPDLLYIPEYKLRTVSGQMRLEANFDLLIAGDGFVEIWDWKTGINRAGAGNARSRNKLAASCQTMVYMFVLKERIASVTGKDAEDMKISMCYWQPCPPGVIDRIEYSGELHQGFREALTYKIQKILHYDYSSFDCAPYTRHCRYCEFKWFCSRSTN